MAVHTIRGNFTSVNARIGIVTSRWNSFITERLKEGAVENLLAHGIKEKDITVVYCPGAYEIPLTAKLMLESGNYDGIICLGAVIRGSTPHFEYVAGAVNNGVAKISLDYEKPVIFGVLTTDTIEQAVERAGTKAGNKGEEAAQALIEMISVSNQLKSE
ncbi:MAG: 6,7-dimethyl-8-ribityllumazine synthase [Rhodothermaceae bacterium]|nr:6,7-dimethyl-8-ribityllumazine synthase [Rhodothermaceae bacterium]